MSGKKQIGRALALGLAVVLVASCGGSSGPAAPSSTTTSGTTGAMISGTVSGTTTSSASGMAPLGATTGVTVTVSGTGLTVTVDSQGRFAFTGVPAGTVQLVFTAGGASATITLDGVQPTDKITLKVTLKGTTASLDDEERNGTAMTELEDRIVAINPAGTTRTLDVGTTRVSVPPEATIRRGNDDKVDFATLKVGDRVHVRGTMTGSLMTASLVIVQNTNAKVPVNASGAVSALQGACPSIRFTVGGWDVETNAATDFQKGTCLSVANNTSVHVKGDVQANGRVLATWVQIGK